MKEFLGLLVLFVPLFPMEENGKQITLRSLAELLHQEPIYCSSSLDVSAKRLSDINVISHLSLNNVPFTQIMKHLIASNNCIQKIPKGLAHFAQLQTLNLQDNCIDHIPDEIFDLTQLRSLNLNDNKINNIADKVSKLVQLRCLFLDNNCLQEFPMITTLTRLKALYLFDNQIKAFISSSFILPTRLEELDISHNQIDVIPAEIGILTKLKNLLLKNNKIRVVPDELAKCVLLEQLDLSGNQIKVIPAEIGDCFCLQTFSLNNNHVGDLPESITKLTAINNLQLLENHQKLLTFIFDDKNNKTIFNFIQRLRIQKKVQYGNPLKNLGLPHEIKREIYQHIS